MGIIEQVKQMKIEEARQKGERAGRKAALREAKVKTVKRLLSLRLPIKDVALGAGVSIAFVEKLKKSTK